MKQNKTQKETDVYIKDEGYADIKFISLKSKEWAHKNQIRNSLAQFGDTFCGEPVWYRGMKKGQYTIGVELSNLKPIIEKMKKSNLIVESEIDTQFI